MRLALRTTHIHALRVFTVSLDCVILAALSLTFTMPVEAALDIQKEQGMIQHPVRIDAFKSPLLDAIHPSTDGRVKTDAWMYPDEPGAKAALVRIGHLNAIKAEFFNIDDSGQLNRIDQSEASPNGYSAENVALLKQHSKEQYITVSGWYEGTKTAMRNPATVTTLVDLAKETGFGIELDWEGFGEWTPEYYHDFKQFLRQLGSRLHEHDLKLIVDGPPINDVNSQNWYQWKYEDIAPLVDQTVMMIYDNQYDTGVGHSIAPTDWSAQCLEWLKRTAGDKGVAGIAAYGYKGNDDSGRMAVLPSDTILRAIRNLDKSRNADGELVVKTGDIFYSYADSTTLNRRYDQVADHGIRQLSVWSLGSNPWFSIKP